MSLALILKQAGLRDDAVEPLDVAGATLWAVTVAKEEAVSTWLRLRKVVPFSKHWPLLVGSADRLNGLDLPTLAEVEGVLEEAARLNAEELLERAIDTGFGARPVRAPRPPAPIANLESVALCEGARVGILLLPTQRSWEASAWLGFGGFNGCPTSEVHVRTLRRWHEQWGADVVAIGADSLEVSISRPPDDVESAQEFAEELRDYGEFDGADESLSEDSARAFIDSLRRDAVLVFWWD